MNKVLHDQPDDPIVYLIRCLYRKAALPVPKDLKPGTLRRSSPERVGRRNKSPEKVSSSQNWAVGSGPELVDRSYEKPWLVSSKKTKHRDDKDETATKQGKKQTWNADTKVTTTTFDELFNEDTSKAEQQRAVVKEDSPSITKAWSRKVALDDGEDVNFRSRGYQGPRPQRDEEDPLAGEIMLACETPAQESSVSSSKKRGIRLETQKHRRDLEKILNDTDKVSLDSGFDGYDDDNVEDDAIELLEDPEDLIREGVTKISPAGYKLSRVLRQRQEEANVKLNINFQTPLVDPQPTSKGETYDEFYAEEFSRPPTGMSFRTINSENSPLVSDEDDFESVSQVVGPRKPVWNVGESDNETYRVDKPEVSSVGRDAGLPRAPKNPKAFSATLPPRIDSRDSVDEDNFFTEANKTWAAPRTNKETTPPDVRESLRSVRSQDGGWAIPDDTEVSMTSAWSAQTSSRPNQGPPKAY